LLTWCRALGINTARNEQYRVPNFLKLLRSSTSALPGEMLNSVFLFQMSPRTTQHCAGSTLLPASYGLSGPV